MIKVLVDLLSGLIQLALFLLVIAGCILGYYFLPEQWPYFKHGDLEFFEVLPFFRGLAGGVIAVLLECIFFGPLLILLDIREAVRAMGRKDPS
jgi:hypothetical protein